MPFDDGLRGEELVVEIEGQRAPPVIRLHLGHVVPVVLAGIVDENIHAAPIGLDLGQHRAQRRNVGDIAGVKSGAGCSRQRLPCSVAMSMKDTRAPCATKAFTISSPIPDAPPVITTDRFSRDRYRTLV